MSIMQEDALVVRGMTAIEREMRAAIDVSNSLRVRYMEVLPDEFPP